MIFRIWCLNFITTVIPFLGHFLKTYLLYIMYSFIIFIIYFVLIEFCCVSQIEFGKEKSCDLITHVI